MESISAEIGGRELIIETGHMARQAGGAAVMRYGDTMVLVTATSDKREQPPRGFLPLAVHYVEKMYASGKIPGGFFKREGRLSDPETLISRFIDRPIRPLFPDNYNYETQVIATVLSTDHLNEPAIAAMTGTSAALMISDIPFAGPIAGVRVARVDGEFLINPYPEQAEQGDLNFIIAGSKDAILMVEGTAKEVPESVALEAILFGHKAMQPLISMQEKLQKKIGKNKRVVVPVKIDAKLMKDVEKYCQAKLGKALQVKDKGERYESLDALGQETLDKFYNPERDDESVGKTVKGIYGDLKKQVMRERILKDGARVDGRSLTDVRPITCEVGVLPRVHGSALFTRGETQALVAVTLGARDDEQLIDNLAGVSFKSFLFHYNFPPFSVGETTFLRGPGRREIGHGFLAEKAVTALLPRKEEFPYTIRIVSEILESNGSSSMASVCGASLAMMDAGVPIKAQVAGIAMGLIQEKKKTAILSDILGDEDHLGDMDFKVAGTEEGVTALQMDIKISGIDKKVLEAALQQAREGRLHILNIMNETLTSARQGLSQYAPRFVAYKISREKIRDLIGPGGKMIRGIVEKTGAKVDVNDDGVVAISSRDHAAVDEALEMVKSITQEIEIGAVYHGPVKKVLDFGAFVELTPGTDGLVHISQLKEERVENIEDVIKEGDMVTVKVIGFDKRGKLKLTMVMN
ncbi:MAG: polyribonucleotide nucleotidyltransferase [SAR324 cluster bacterium]|nr:polyribonucleotide nucleotidyltransferase [SAR324 cluster bacterium]MCZ6646066.1 polyribonucleotide nucleotidyltransferase [SAR324 cluster bacterium]